MTINMQGTFNARAIDPNQGGLGIHPVGRFPSTIIETEIKENKDKKGGHFAVTYQTPAGSIIKTYNIWNESQKAMEIAQGQLSALCHATGRYEVNWADQGAALRGAQCMIEVGFQKDQGPNAPESNTNKGYTEIKKVLDSAGNEPGKPNNNPQPQQAQQQQPLTSQGNGNWGNNSPNQQPDNQQSQQNWNNSNSQAGPIPSAQAGSPNNSGGAWQPGGNSGGGQQSAPWGNRG